MEGEGLVHFITSMMSRGERGVPHQRTSLRPYLLVSVPSNGVSNVCEAKNVPLLVQNEGRVCNHPPPSSVQLGRHSCDKMDNSFPIHFCKLKAIKKWPVGRPGNDAMYSVQACNHRRSKVDNRVLVQH